MYVTQMTRFKGGKPEEMIAAAKKAKVVWEKNGAEFFRLSRFHTGQWAGEWLTIVRFADWATFGKAQDAVAKDAAYQRLLSQVLSKAELTGRTVTVGVDL